MKKIIIMLFMSSLLFGCSTNIKDKTEEDIKINNESSDTAVLYEFGHGIDGYDGNTLELKNLKEIKYKIENKSKALEAGIVVFFDGNLQQYSLNNKSEDKFMHVISVKDNETKTVLLNLDKIILDEQKEHVLNIGVVLNPNPISNLTSYEVNHSISQAEDILVTSTSKDSFEKSLGFKKAKCTEENIKESDLKSIDMKNMSDMDEHMSLQVIQNNEVKYDYINSKEKIYIKLAGAYGEYNMFIFADGKPYKPDEICYGIETVKGKFSIIELDLANELESNKNFFVVLAPKKKGRYIEQSEKFIIKDVNNNDQ